MTQANFDLPGDQVLQWVPGALLIVAATGRIVQANALAEQLFGYPQETLAGQPLDNLIPERFRGRHRHHLSAYFHDPRPRPMGGGQELYGLRQDGSEFPLAVHLSPIPGSTTLAAAAVQDLTGYERTQQALEQAAGILEQQLQAHADELSRLHAELWRQRAGRLQAEDALRRTEILYRQLVENQPDLICRFLPDTTLTFVNTAYARFFGSQPEALIGRRFIELIAPEDRAAIQAYLATFTPTRPAGQYEHGVVRADGVLRWHLWHDFAFFDEHGRIVDFQAVGIDITERKQAEEALAVERERAQVTLHSIGDAVITTDAQGQVEYLNPAAETLTGWTGAAARGRPLHEVFPIIEESSRQPAPDPVARCLREGRIVGLANHSVLLSRSGKEYDIEDSAAPILGRDGQLLGAVLIFRDVTEARQLTRQMRYDATHDALTGLVNRREFERRLERALASAKHYGVRHALCYLDLDHFKRVNDTVGHAAGDELLKQINGLLLGSFRERDTLARLGGDEFGLLLDNCPLERASLIAQTVVSTIHDYRFTWQDQTFQIGVSIGLVPVTAAAKDSAQLLAQADIACYTAKQLGRNRVHVYRQENGESSQHHRELLPAARLRDALEQGCFRLYRQPIVPLGGDATVRYELLLRLVTDDGEILLPAAFIPPAERYGLMGEIDRWVIQTALRRYRDDAGMSGAGIHFNLSDNALSDPSFVDFVQAQLLELAVPPEQLCFEIGETITLHNLRQVTGFMTALRDRGCRLALDEFGRGLSSLHYLKSLPLDYLKIDGGFVKDMLEDARDYAMVAALNQLGHTLGIQTIALYAGSEAIVGRLRALGVDYAQGDALGQAQPWAAIQPADG